MFGACITRAQQPMIFVMHAPNMARVTFVNHAHNTHRPQRASSQENMKAPTGARHTQRDTPSHFLYFCITFILKGWIEGSGLGNPPHFHWDRERFFRPRDHALGGWPPSCEEMSGRLRIDMYERIKMKVIGMLVVMLITGLVMGAERPPVLEPNDVPFAYDPNSCPSPVMDWRITRMGTASIYSISAHDEAAVAIVMSGYIAGSDVLVYYLDKAKDPNGGWNQYWNCAFTLNRTGVHYLEFTASDTIGREDRRTVLILSVEDDGLFIFPGAPPIITKVEDAQRLVQHAKKKQFPMTKPVRVLN